MHAMHVESYKGEIIPLIWASASQFFGITCLKKSSKRRGQGCSFTSSHIASSFSVTSCREPLRVIMQHPTRISTRSFMSSKTSANISLLSCSQYTLHVTCNCFARVLRRVVRPPRNVSLRPDLIRTARHTMATENVKIPSLHLDLGFQLGFPSVT